MLLVVFVVCLLGGKLHFWSGCVGGWIELNFFFFFTKGHGEFVVWVVFRI